MLATVVAIAALAVAPLDDPSTTTGAVSFRGDWETAITGPGTWKNRQTVRPDSIERVTDIVRQGAYAARFEVRPGDDPIHSSGERAEVLGMVDPDGKPLRESAASGTQFYAFSVRLAPDWQAPAATNHNDWAIVFQLHGPDDLKASPSIAVSVQDQLGISLYGGDLDARDRSIRSHNPLSDSSLNPGHWIDLVLKVHYAADFTGTVDVWRRDEGGAEFAKVLELRNVPTLQYRSSQGDVKPHYWKHGLYRSKQTTITNVLWLDGLTRGDSFEAVVKAAFAPPSAISAKPVVPATKD
jgi:hypothetical protein